MMNDTGADAFHLRRSPRGDGFAFHSSADRFESDRRRDAVLAATGLRVIRVTWPQMLSEPEAMLVRLGQALVRTSPL
jgi:very-short-patch-repair endonuclease